MIYNEPVYRTAGDLCLSIEYADEVNTSISFRVIALNQTLNESNIEGIISTIPTARSLGVIYNPFKVTKDELVKKLKIIESDVKDVQELPSRLIKIPLWYNDPLSAECAKSHKTPNNIESVAQFNNVTVDDVIVIHSSVEWWVTHTGFLAGTFASYPLRNIRLTTPRYRVPRTWSPERAIVLGGRSTASHAVVSPGGFQLLGRTPIELYDPKRRNPVFNIDPVLVKVGDRIRFIPIIEDKYNEIRTQVEETTYKYEIESGTYRLENTPS